MRRWCFTVACALLAGCGSSSQGTSGTDGNALEPQPVPGVVRVQVGTQGPTVDTTLYGAQFTLRFPPTVTLPADNGDRMLPAQALLPAVSGSFAGASYLDAVTGSGPAIRVNVSHPSGFTVGPLVTVTGTVAAGASLGASEVVLSDFSPRDENGVPIPAITATLTLQTQ